MDAASDGGSRVSGGSNSKRADDRLMPASRRGPSFEPFDAPCFDARTVFRDEVLRDIVDVALARHVLLTACQQDERVANEVENQWGSLDKLRRVLGYTTPDEKQRGRSMDVCPIEESLERRLDLVEFAKRFRFEAISDGRVRALFQMLVAIEDEAVKSALSESGYETSWIAGRLEALAGRESDGHR